MTNINGRWLLESTENTEAFLKAIGVSDDHIAQALPKVDAVGSFGEEFIFDKEGKTGRRNIYHDGSLVREGKDVPIGAETTVTKALDGRQVKNQFELVSPDKLIRTETGEGFTATHVLEVAGDQLTITLTCGDVTSVRKYKKHE